MSWQPIETAPKDGSWFLVWMPHDRKHDLPRLAHWTHWSTYDGRKDRRFRFTGCGPTDPPKQALWHPLPEPPGG